MKLLKSIRQVIAFMLGVLGVTLLIIAAWIGIDEEDWAESYEKH